MGAVGQDLRHACRMLRRTPAFTLTALLTLGLGIGATTAIFTLVYDVLLKPLPYAQPDRLVAIEERVAEFANVYPVLPVSANHFTFWQRHSRSFEAMAALEEDSAPFSRQQGAGASGPPLQIGVLKATPGLFSVLGVQPELGRAFKADEAQPGHDPVVVLMYGLWRNQFGGDPKIVGKIIRLDGFPYTVVGVMPQSFRMPPALTTASFGRTRRQPVGALLPMAFTKGELAEAMGDLNYFGLGRLQPGVSVAQATADLNALQHTISANLAPDDKATLSIALTPFQEQLVGSNRKALLILLAAVAGLLLVGCVNITNLLLARAVGRKQQMAVAAALGASRAEMVRMALRETAVLAAAGGGLGVLLAANIVPGMQRYLPAALDFRGPLHLDWAGAGCALLLAVFATLLAGAAPALLVSRTSPQEVLHSESRLASESRGSRRARRVLVGIEVAVSVALVLMTGLLTTSLVKLMHVHRGFTADRTMTVTIDLPQQSYPDRHRRAEFYTEVLQKLDGLPGVEHAAVASVLPLTGDSWGDTAQLPGDTRPAAQLPVESFRWVSPDYFAAIQLPLVSGQFFNPGDWGRNLAVVSQRTAKTLWPDSDPVGQTFVRAGTNHKPFTVVGVVGDARTVSLAKPDPMLIYVPYWFRCDASAGLVVRTRQDPSAMADALRQTVWSVDRGVPVPAVRALGGLVADSVANQRFEMELLLLFAASALLLAGLGVYGVVMYSVAQRHREIGLRMALGAQPANVHRLVLRDGLAPVFFGAAAGLAVAFASARVMNSLLFQVSPYDPALAVGAVITLLAVGTAACLLPARRAAGVAPMQALRGE